MKISKHSLITAFLVACMATPGLRAESKNSKNSENIVIVNVDSAPEFIGGDDAMFEWIDANKRYPESMLKKRKRGVVVVDFLVEADGKLSDIHVTKKLNKDADSEALRLVHSMPAWKAATYQGHTVAVPFSLSIAFNPPLNEDEGQPKYFATWLKGKLTHKDAETTAEDAPAPSTAQTTAAPVYFVNGVIFEGDVNSIKLTDIESISEQEPSAEYPGGRIDIKLKKK